MNARPYKGHSVNFLPRDYTVVDIETNGLFSGRCEILEISAVRFADGEKTGAYSTLIKPTRKIDRFITRLTGITDEMAAGGIDIGEALDGFTHFIKDDIIVGYNVNFDINFLYDSLTEHRNMPLSNDWLDVLRLTRKYLPQLENHKQTTVAQYLGIDIRGAHRAEKDCLICSAVYERLRTRFISDNEKVRTMEQK